MTHLLFKPVLKLAIAFILLAELSASPAGAEDSTGTATDSVQTDPWCRVEIETATVETGELYDTLDILYATNAIDLAGYMLKLGVDNDLLAIVDILPGEVIDSCAWEMFRANQVAAGPDASDVAELWQITALARVGFDEDSEPVCYRFDRPVSLARLVVSSLNLTLAPDTTAAIFYYWESCRDNILSDRDGAAILVSDTVTNSIPISFSTGVDRFPTWRGTPAECVSPSAANVPRRVVEFVNGGVAFELEVEPGDQDTASTVE